jgi:hypothetical protein
MDKLPTRGVENNLLVSDDLPAIKLKVDDSLRYVGRLQFELYGLADADIFVFAEADEDRTLKRWLVVQFEGFLDSNSHTYNYAMIDRVTLGSHEYMTDAFTANMRQLREEMPADSDGARVVWLLEEHGYVRPQEAIWVRLVRTLGDDRRKELLFIYTEDLARLGLTAEQVSPDGLVPLAHTALLQGVRDRARNAFTIIED